MPDAAPWGDSLYLNLLITNKITFNPKLNEFFFFAEEDLYILN